MVGQQGRLLIAYWLVGSQLGGVCGCDVTEALADPSPECNVNAIRCPFDGYLVSCRPRGYNSPGHLQRLRAWSLQQADYDRKFRRQPGGFRSQPKNPGDARQEADFDLRAGHWR